MGWGAIYGMSLFPLTISIFWKWASSNGEWMWWWTNKCSQWAAICGAFYGLSIMLSKLALLRLYLRYSAQKPTVFIWATATVVILYSLVASFQWTFACRPLEKFWDLRIAYGSCIEWSNIAVFSGAMNTATDIIILLLPIFILRHLRLPRRDKFMVALAMMTGGLYVSC